MNTSPRSRSLVMIIIFLLITNIAMLLFFVFSSKPTQRHSRNDDRNAMYHSLEKEVGFSKAQLEKYQALRKDQMGNVRSLFNDVRVAKRNFYELLYMPAAPDSLLDRYADSIALKQKVLDRNMLRYFKNIRNLCTPEQTQKFDSTIKKQVSRMIGRSGRGNSERKSK